MSGRALTGCSKSGVGRFDGWCQVTGSMRKIGNPRLGGHG